MQYFEFNRPMQTFVPALRSILTAPGAFFTDAPTTAAYSGSFFFLSIVIFLASFIGVPFRDMTLLFLLPVTWGLTAISVRLWAAYLCWAAKRFADVSISSSNAFMIASYASAPLLFSFLPFIGSLAGIWNLYLLWIALTQRYSIKSGTAITILAIPTIVVVISAAVLVLTLMRTVSMG